jgi:hypothetical protein
MKIVVYNLKGQYALSRAEVEIIYSTLPRLAWARIAEFHLAHSHDRACEMFEFDDRSGIVFFIAPIGSKTRVLRDKAIHELLVGLARVKARSRFFMPLKDPERSLYSAFVDEWMQRCIHAIEQRSNRAGAP